MRLAYDNRMRTTPIIVTERFRELRERAGLSMDELARRMGYARASSIQRYENPDEYKKNYIGPDLTEKLVKAIVGRGNPPIDASEVWALCRPTLRGPVISSYDPDDPDGHSHDDDEDVYSREFWTPHITGALPEIDVKLGAGEGSVGEVINLPVGKENISGHRVVAEWLIPLDYLRNEAKAAASHTVVMEIVGDSMQPTFLPGDRVIVDLSQTEFLHDGVYAFSDGLSPPQVKKIQRVPFTNPPEVRIVSDNTTGYETFQVELSRVHIIGRICGHVSRK